MKYILSLTFILLLPCVLFSQEVEEISLTTFLQQSLNRDPYFRAILMDQYSLWYAKVRGLSSGDIHAEVTGQYKVYLDDGKGDTPSQLEGGLALSKLFPMSGTSITGSVNRSGSMIQGNSVIQDSWSLEMAQDIARNAFGKGTRLLENRIELQSELARYQIVESYEEYLASIIDLYQNWYAAAENVKTAKELLQYNRNILGIIARKRQYGVAHPEEVLQMQNQVIDAEMNLLLLTHEEERYRIAVREMLHVDESWHHQPVLASEAPEVPDTEEVAMAMLAQSRSHAMRQLMEREGVTTLQIAEDNLMPTAKLFGGYSRIDSEYYVSSPRHSVYGGVTAELDFGNTQARAEKKVAEIELERQKLENQHSLMSLRRDARILYRQIAMEKKRLALLEKKITYAQSVLAAQRRNYLIGKATLTQLIDAMNDLSRARYELQYHRVTERRLIYEWKRITDTLVRREDVLRDTVYGSEQ